MASLSCLLSITNTFLFCMPGLSFKMAIFLLYANRLKVWTSCILVKIIIIAGLVLMQLSSFSHNSIYCLTLGGTNSLLYFDEAILFFFAVDKPNMSAMLCSSLYAVYYEPEGFLVLPFVYATFVLL